MENSKLQTTPFKSKMTSNLQNQTIFPDTDLMYVIKRDGRKEEVKFDKITARIRKLCYGFDHKFINPLKISQKVISGVYNEVTTSELDNLAAEVAAYSSTVHPDYSLLASRIGISNLHKNTKKIFSDCIEDLHNYINPITNKKSPKICKEIYDVIMHNKDKLNSAIIYDRDFKIDYFGFKTLEKSYLLRIDEKVVERPQHLFMRIAISIHYDNIDKAIETYNLMANKNFIHATPTLYNAGTTRQQLSSCFLLTMNEDSINGIYKTLQNCALISKYAGGIGLSIHDIRAKDSYIAGTNGISNGIVPMLRVFNDTARYVDQGGGKRKGSFAIYIEPWHADIFEFMELRKNHGNELMRARDLFYALWVPDLFMKRVKENLSWSLFCPNEAKGLSDVWGDEFERLYTKYEKDGLARKTIKAQDLWFKIINSQMETGTPYMVYKDACNRKSNQQNLGTIKSSNLCTEIVEYTSPDEIAVCNLASINLQSCINDELNTFDFGKLCEITKIITFNLNRIIDINFYPVKEAEYSNKKNRPIGIGVQGLADTFARLKMPFTSSDAKQLNIDIFETIYYAAMTCSMELAKEHGPYETYEGSPVSKGIFQFDMWNITPSSKWDWESLKKEVKEHGIRNSLLLAPMPTASTAQILGNNESIEPFTSNIYSRRVLSGEFTIVNKYLMKDLVRLELWNEKIKNEIIHNKGSIQTIREIPHQLKELYKTVWEIKQKDLIEMSADRGPYICQSQSLNIHISDPSISKMTSCHFYSWEKGLKTGMYYLRSRPKTDAISFTVDKSMLQSTEDNQSSGSNSNKNSDEDDICEMCSA